MINTKTDCHASYYMLKSIINLNSGLSTRFNDGVNIGKSCIGAFYFTLFYIGVMQV